MTDDFWLDQSGGAGACAPLAEFAELFLGLPMGSAPYGEAEPFASRSDGRYARNTRSILGGPHRNLTVFFQVVIVVQGQLTSRKFSL